MQSGKTLTGLMGNTNISSVGSTVTGAIANIGKQEWTRLASVTGTTSVDLSNITFRELYVSVYAANINLNMTFYILKQELTSSDMFYRTGCYNEGVYGVDVRIKVSTSRVVLQNARYSVDDETSTVSLTVFYK